MVGARGREAQTRLEWGHSHRFDGARRRIPRSVRIKVSCDASTIPEKGAFWLPTFANSVHENPPFFQRMLSIGL